MLILKTILRTCALALLISCGLSAQQDIPLQLVSHFEFVDGQEAAGLTYLQRQSDAYKKAGLWDQYAARVYQFDDNSLDVIFQIKDLAGADRVGASVKQAEMMHPEAERKDIWNNERRAELITVYHNTVRVAVQPFSYRAADSGFSGPAPFLKVVTYRHALADQRKIGMLSAQAVSFSQREKMQTSHQFVMGVMGGEPNTFQIIYEAKSAEDLKRRQAADMKLAPEEQKAWWAEMSPLVEEVSTRTGRYLPELSRDAEPEPSYLFAVSEEHFTAGKEKDYATGYGLIKKALRKGKADFYWNSHVMEDGRVYNSVPIDNMSDLDVIGEQFAKRRYQVQPADWQAIGKAMGTLPEGERSMIVRYHPELSYTDPMAVGTDKFTHFVQVEYTFAEKDRAAMLELAKDAVGDNREAKSPLPYQVFSYTMGGPTAMLTVRYYGTSKQNVIATVTKATKMMAGPQQDAWNKRADKLVKESAPVFGRAAPEFSYQPVAEVKK